MLTNVNDPAAGTVTTQFPIHGGRANESRMWVDGLNVGNPPGGGQPPTYVADIGNAQEIAFTTSGGLGESETAGLVMNVVPKTGGNEVHGAAFYSGTTTGLQADNGSGVPKLNDVYDLNVSVGGPIMRDRVWYFVNGRTQAATRYIPGIFYNNNAGDATKWLYSPDTEPAAVHRSQVGEHQRPRDVAGDAEAQDRRLLGRAGGLPVVRGHDLRHHRSGAHVAGGGRSQPVQAAARDAAHLVVAVLRTGCCFEAGLGTTYYGWGNFERDPNPTRNLIRVQEQCAAGCAGNGGIAGPLLPLAGLRRQLHRRLRVARVGVCTSPARTA